MIAADGASGATKLGPDIAMGEVPQGAVRAGHWQAAESRGDWTLAGCTVSPGFEFPGFDGAGGLGALDFSARTPIISFAAINPAARDQDGGEPKRQVGSA